MVSPVLAALQAAVVGQRGAAPMSIPNPNPGFRGELLAPNRFPQRDPFPPRPGFDPNTYAVEYDRALASPSRLARLNQALKGQPIKKTAATRVFFDDPREAYDFQQGLINASIMSGKPWKGNTPKAWVIPKSEFGVGGTGTNIQYGSA